MSRVQLWCGAAACGVCVLACCLSGLGAQPPGPGRGEGRRAGLGAGGAGGMGLLNVDQLMERFDKNKDGKLTRDELPPQMAQWLMRADADQDGAISKSELMEAQQRIAAMRGGAGAGGPPGMPSADEIFQRLDKNGDGKLTKDEIPAPMAERFAQADTNGDGVITKAELEEARKQMMGAGPGGPAARGGFDPAQLFARLDKNGDGKLTKDELPARMAERLSKADANGDGVITKAEFEEAMKQVRGQFGRKAEAKSKP